MQFQMNWKKAENMNQFIMYIKYYLAVWFKKYKN